MSDDLSHRKQIAETLKRVSPIALCSHCIRHMLKWENVDYISGATASLARRDPGFEWEDGKCQGCQNRYGTWKVARYVLPIGGETD